MPIEKAKKIVPKENWSEYLVRRRKENKNRMKEWAVDRREHLRRYGIHVRMEKFGLDYEFYDTMLRLQDGGCAICRGKPSKSSLSIDHDHSTGKIRGLLCQQCNLMIGNSSDSPEILGAGKKYLEAYRRIQ